MIQELRKLKDQISALQQVVASQEAAIQALVQRVQAIESRRLSLPKKDQ